MKKLFIRNFVLLLAAAALVSCVSGHRPTATRNGRPPSAAPSPAIPQLAERIPATDPRFRYEGRFDFSDSNGPVIIWQASRICVDFASDALALWFDNARGQCFFNATVDGANTVVGVCEGKPVTPAVLTGLGPGRHHLELFKRSEADAGTVRFRGVELAAGAEVWASPAPNYRMRMEFFGDSITVGACNEDGPEDQWTDRRTHNAALSYAALTAEAFSADYRNIAVSGMGISTGWVSKVAGQVWDKIYPDPNSPRADLNAWIPRVVFVNYGENDDSFSRVHGQPFPTSYTDNYIALIHAIRAAYPATQIVLLRGGMSGGAESEPLRQSWESAVSQLETTDPAISHFVFTHWTRNHPRVADDRIMADELIAWLKQQRFMQRDRPAR